MGGERDDFYNEVYTDPAESFWRALFGISAFIEGVSEINISQALSRFELDTPYDFFMSSRYHDASADECRVEEMPRICYETDGAVTARTSVTFFDSTAADVPVGPAAPLPAAGLAGLCLRRKQQA
ncbi:hypothetical protein [Allohahella sp. A8]|uniref:hypothetical protein n=1 Tax=Allohahella sp. A8 TaxID=3141461 RepID=UPI003A7FEDB2